MDFDNPTEGYYWLQSGERSHDGLHVKWFRPEIVYVVYANYRRKKQWRVYGRTWSESLARYQNGTVIETRSDLSKISRTYRWEAIQPPTFMKGE